MLFKDQIEKRLEQEDSALQDVVGNLVDDLGLHTHFKMKSSADNSTLKQLFQALKITDYTLDEEDFFTTVDRQLEQVLKPQGIMKRNISLSGKWWSETVGPILGKDKDGNFVTLLPLKWSRSYCYTNNKGKRVRVNRKRMRNDLDEQAICFYPALPQRSLTLKDLLVFVASVIRLPEVILLLCACLVVSLFGMFFPLLNKVIFDDIIPNGIFKDLYPIGVLLIGVGIGSTLFEITRNLILTRFKDLINIHLQNAVVARTFSLPPNFFWKYSSGELSNRITAVSSLCLSLNDIALSTLLTLVFSIVYLWQIMVYASALLFPVLFLICAQLVLLSIYYVLSQNNQQKYLLQDSKLNGLTFNLFSGIAKLKVTGSEKRAFTRWLDAYRASIALIYNPHTLLKLMPAILSFCSIAGTILFYYSSLQAGISSSDYIAFSVAYGMIGGVMGTLAGVIPKLAQLKPLSKLSEPIMKAEPETSSNAPQVSLLSGNIELSNLSFRYSSDSSWVLRNLNIKIKAGEYVAIVGKSGCGKSTLVRLLLGFEKPMSGGIFYDNYDLSTVDKTSLRQHIGSCLQSGSLFPGNIFSNITVTAPNSSIEDAWNAARLADIEQEIKDLPMGMYTLISEGGGGLSGGQKQRLLIARSLISKPSIVFFDEATSALDNISQKKVSDNLDSLKCTRLVIAHRFSTIRRCNRIIVLDNGGIAEEGTFDELMEKGGLFYQMSKRQL